MRGSGGAGADRPGLAGPLRPPRRTTSWSPTRSGSSARFAAWLAQQEVNGRALHRRAAAVAGGDPRPRRRQPAHRAGRLRVRAVRAEGRDRIGGRAFFGPFPAAGCSVELGGAWFDADHQTPMREEANRYGVAIAEATPYQSTRWFTGGELRSGLPVPRWEGGGLERTPKSLSEKGVDWVRGSTIADFVRSLPCPASPTRLIFSDAQWRVLAPLLPPAKPGGRPAQRRPARDRQRDPLRRPQRDRPGGRCRTTSRPGRPSTTTSAPGACDGTWERRPRRAARAGAHARPGAIPAPARPSSTASRSRRPKRGAARLRRGQEGDRPQAPPPRRHARACCWPWWCMPPTSRTATGPSWCWPSWPGASPGWG